MYNSDPTVELDPKYLNKFGTNEYGKRKWNSMGEVEKKKKVVQMMNDFDYESAMKQTGFTHFNNILETYLSNADQKQYLTGHIKYDLSQIKDPTDCNIDEQLKSFRLLRVRLGCIRYAFDQQAEQKRDEEAQDFYAIAFDAFMDKYEIIQKTYLTPEKPAVDDNQYAIMETVKKVFEAVRTTFKGLRPDDPETSSPITVLNENMNTYLIAKLGKYDITVDQMNEIFDTLTSNDCPELKKTICNIMGNLWKYNFTTHEGKISEDIIVNTIKNTIYTYIPYDMSPYEKTTIAYNNLMNIYKTTTAQTHTPYYWISVLEYCNSSNIIKFHLNVMGGKYAKLITLIKMVAYQNGPNHNAMLPYEDLCASDPDIALVKYCISGCYTQL